MFYQKKRRAILLSVALIMQPAQLVHANLFETIKKYSVKTLIYVLPAIVVGAVMYTKVKKAEQRVQSLETKLRAYDDAHSGCGQWICVPELCEPGCPFDGDKEC